MTDQTIPADKVRDILRRYDGGLTDQLENDLRALLPAQQPTTGLLGRWAKHPDYGDVMCAWDKEKDGWIGIRNRGGNDGTGVELHQVPLDSLTFPHQATKPADVPADQPWLVDVEAAHVTEKNVMGVRNEDGDWRLYCREKAGVDYCTDEGITLVCPLTPERPGKDDLQAKYDDLEKRWKHLDDLYSARGSFIDELNAKYREAQERIKTLEQPAWRIEHDHTNLRVGEYIIDCDGDTGVITDKSHSGYWRTNSWLVAFPDYAPFIVFPNRDAATPDAVAEAKKARDKETRE